MNKYNPLVGLNLDYFESASKLDHNTEILNADRTILITDKPIQFLDANGADRDIILSAEASSTDLVFIFVNVSNGAGENLVIRNNNPTTLIIIGPGQGTKVSCDGINWKVQDNSGVYYDGVNNRVGVGTISPEAKLDVAEDVRARSFYADLTNIDGTGTITTVGTAITGSGTSFTTELEIGDHIYWSGGANTIKSITDDTHATLVWAGTVDASNEVFTFRKPAFKSPGFMVQADGNVSTQSAVAAQADFYLSESSEHSTSLKIENKYPTNTSAPAYIELSREIVDYSQRALIGMDDTGRDFFIWVNGTDRLNIDTLGNFDFHSNYALQLQNIFDLDSKGEGYQFDGSNDKITITDNTLIDDVFSNGGSLIQSFCLGNDPSADVSRFIDKGIFLLMVSTTLGDTHKLQFNQGFSGTDGTWRTNDYVLTEQIRNTLAVVYNSSAPVNNPSMYLGGKLLVITRTSATPTGTFTTDNGFNFIVANRDAGDRALPSEIFRTLLFNLALTADEVKAFSSGAPIPYKYIGASQITINAGSFIIDKTYRIVTAGNTDFIGLGAANSNIGTEFVTTGVGAGTGTATQIGCVLQLEQDGIGHGQWQDKSGNELVGTVSGALPINLSVNHQERYLDLIVTGNGSFTLPKGYKIKSIIVKETAGNALTGGLDVGFSVNGTEIVSGMAVGGNATVLCTLVETGTIGATFTTADDIIYYSDGDDDANWNSASLELRVQMQRLTLN